MLKRISGFLGVVLGGLGMLLCLVVIIGAWWVNGPVTDGLLKIFPPIEAALAFGDSAANQFGDFVGNTQTQFADVTDAQPVATALADEIEQVSVYVDVAKGLAGSAEQTISGVASSASLQPGAKGNVTAGVAGRLLETLNGVTDTLDQAGTLAQNVSDGRTEKIDQLNEQLVALETSSADVQTAIEQTQSDVDEIKLKVPRWINLGSLIVTLIFLWFGIAQYFLLRHSWTWLRQSQPA